MSEVEDEDIVQEERARKAAVRKSKMETGLNTEDQSLKEKKKVSQEEWRKFLLRAPQDSPQLNSESLS